ncbi:MAG TPA: hypothetical protein VGD43_00535, partial [Micromonospora sp.]
MAFARAATAPGVSALTAARSLGSNRIPPLPQTRSSRSIVAARTAGSSVLPASPINASTTVRGPRAVAPGARAAAAN